MKTTQEMIAVMTAHAEGKKIEVSSGGSRWIETEMPAWDWQHCVYRVKPELKYRPYKDAEECFKFLSQHDMLVRHIDGDYHLIVTISDKYIWLGNASEGIDRDRLLKEFVFLDGSPCGVLEEE